MKETKIYADEFCTTFASTTEMLEFLAERAKQSKWIRKPTRMLKLVPLEKEAETIEEACEKELEGIVEDTEKNTQLVLKVNKDFYPVRDCAIHTILKRAGINGTGLKKLEKATYAKIVNYCLQVAKNSSSMDVNCPFCGETKGKMNVNLQKNVFRCNRCDASGGMLELYGRLHGVSSAEANRQIREALGKGEYRTDYQVVHKEEPVEIFNAELADADVIDRTYQEMLSLLTLNDKHQEDLKKRGLTKEQIEIQRYRSVPLFGIKNMVQKLLESGQTVKGVPGFYEDQDGKWTINFTSKNSGILIPIRSMEGKIQGFQIRLDQVMEGRKYIWLSSVKFQNGVSSGSPVHVIGSLDAEQIYLTEGALKGTIAHYLSGDTFICVAGVNQYRNLKPVLETLKSRHLQHLYEAYDMDKKMKVYCDGDSEKCDACQRKPATFYCPHKMQKRQILQNACRKVYEICSGLSISMSRMVWDMDSYGEWNGQIKGIDDYYYVLKNTG